MSKLIGPFPAKRSACELEREKKSKLKMNYTLQDPFCFYPYKGVPSISRGVVTDVRIVEIKKKEKRNFLRRTVRLLNELPNCAWEEDLCTSRIYFGRIEKWNNDSLPKEEKLKNCATNRKYPPLFKALLNLGKECKYSTILVSRVKGPISKFYDGKCHRLDAGEYEITYFTSRNATPTDTRLRYEYMLRNDSVEAAAETMYQNWLDSLLDDDERNRLALSRWPNDSVQKRLRSSKIQFRRTYRVQREKSFPANHNHKIINNSFSDRTNYKYCVSVDSFRLFAPGDGAQPVRIPEDIYDDYGWYNCYDPVSDAAWGEEDSWVGSGHTFVPAIYRYWEEMWLKKCLQEFKNGKKQNMSVKIDLVVSSLVLDTDAFWMYVADFASVTLVKEYDLIICSYRYDPVEEEEEENDSTQTLEPVKRRSLRIRNKPVRLIDQIQPRADYEQWAKSIPQTTKEAVIRRDKNKCKSCGRTNLKNPEIDHIKPKSVWIEECCENHKRTGEKLSKRVFKKKVHGMTNLQTLCTDCHKRKTKKDIARLKILRESREKR